MWVERCRPSHFFFHHHVYLRTKNAKTELTWVEVFQFVTGKKDHPTPTPGCAPGKLTHPWQLNLNVELSCLSKQNKTKNKEPVQNLVPVS